MARFRVVVSDQVFPSIDVEREILARIDAELVVADGTADGLAQLGGEADGVLNTYLPIDAALVARLSRCRIIARYGIGIDNIDVPAAANAGITVTNVPDYSVEEVAAHTLALILAVVRRLPEADRKVRGGGWGLDGLRPIRRVSGLAFGLVGFGRIGQKVALGIEALGGRVVLYDPYLTERPGIPPLVSLDELVSTSDVISVHAPLTPETRNLFDAARIASMPPGSILVNTSRGGLVVLDAVLDALRAGHLAGAALDVFEREPVDAGRLADVPNLLVTPHMAYYSEQSIAESQRKAATQVVKVLTGEPPDYPIKP
jgi:D-3-phosphoglycerate dehydrogenase